MEQSGDCFSSSDQASACNATAHEKLTAIHESSSASVRAEACPQSIAPVQSTLNLWGLASFGVSHGNCTYRVPHRPSGFHWMRANAHWADSAMEASAWFARCCNNSLMRGWAGEARSSL